MGTTTVSSSSIARSRTRKMPLWENIENVATGLYVALSKVEHGAQLCLQEEVPGKEEQLWDYEEARSSGIFRSKTGLVADMKGSVGPELICWPHHGGPNQKFEIKDDCSIHCEIDDKVWDVKEMMNQAALLPVVHLSSGPSMVDHTSSSGSGEKRADKLDPDPDPDPDLDTDPDPDPDPDTDLDLDSDPDPDPDP